jgi:UDP-N-acetylglucosamine acyltransferase
LRRRGFTPERLKAVKQMHKLLYRQGLTLDAANSAMDALNDEMPQAGEDIALMQSFLASSTRGIAR